MSDLIEPKVISQLPVATLPLQGTDKLPVSRDGVNLLYATVADLPPTGSVTQVATLPLSPVQGMLYQTPDDVISYYDDTKSEWKTIGNFVNALTFGTGYNGLKAALQSGKNILFPKGTWTIPVGSEPIELTASNTKFYSFEGAKFVVEGTTNSANQLLYYTADFSNVEFYGIEFISNRVGTADGVFISANLGSIDNLKVRNCRFIAKTSHTNGVSFGIGPFGPSTSIINNIEFSNNYADVGRAGIEVLNNWDVFGASGNIFVRDNVILNAGQVAGAGNAGLGISVVGRQNNVQITGNYIYRARYAGIELTWRTATTQRFSDSLVANNTIVECFIPFNTFPSHTDPGNWRVKGINFIGNTIVNPITRATISHLDDSVIADNRFEINQDDRLFTINTALTKGEYIYDTEASWRYEVIQAGTTGGTAPTWPTTLDATVTSGTVIFKASQSNIGAYPVRFSHLTNCSVTGNSITVNSRPSKTGDGFPFIGHSQNCTFEGNTITTNGLMGLFILSSLADPMTGNKIANTITMTSSTANCAHQVQGSHFTGNVIENTINIPSTASNIDRYYLNQATLSRGNIDTSKMIVTMNEVGSVTFVAGSGGGATGTWGTTGGGGSGARGTFTVTAGAITAATVTDMGYGYTSTPTITILTGSLPTGASITPVLKAFGNVRQDLPYRVNLADNTTQASFEVNLMHKYPSYILAGASGGATLTSAFTFSLPQGLSDSYLITNNTGQMATINCNLDGTTVRIPTGITNLVYVDQNGNVTIADDGVGERDTTYSALPFTSFDFSTAPNGALPATDALGNPFYLELGAGGANATPIVDNGALRTTGIAVGTPTAFYLGTRQNGVIYEMGCKAILGDGVMTMLIAQNPSPGIFSNPNWAMHLKVSELEVVYELWVANAAVRLKSAGVLLSKTDAHDILVQFQDSTAKVYINGTLVLTATDSRISSFARVQAIFEPFQNSGNVAYTRLISGYVKTSKQASFEVVGVPLPPARQFTVNLASAITLTGTDQAILGNTRLANVSEALVTVRMRLNQTSAGDVILNVIGMTFGAVVTNNEAIISRTVKDDIVTTTLHVTGITGAFFRVMIRGAFGTVPATPTVPERILITVIPTRIDF